MLSTAYGALKNFGVNRQSVEEEDCDTSTRFQLLIAEEEEHYTYNRIEKNKRKLFQEEAEEEEEEEGLGGGGVEIGVDDSDGNNKYGLPPKKRQRRDIFSEMLKMRKKTEKLDAKRKQAKKDMKALENGGGDSGGAGKAGGAGEEGDDVKPGTWIPAPPQELYRLEQEYGPAQPETECFACMELQADTYDTSLERRELDLLNAAIRKNVGTCNMVQHAISISQQYEEKIRKPTNRRIMETYGYCHHECEEGEAAAVENGGDTMDVFQRKMMEKYTVKRRGRSRGTATPKLLPAWSPSTVYKHLMWHKSKISNDIDVFSDILKNTVIGIYENSLMKVHSSNKGLAGTPAVCFDPVQHRMMMLTLDRWMKLKFISPQKLKEMIKYESSAWSQSESVIDYGNKSVYGNSLFLLKDSESGKE